MVRRRYYLMGPCLALSLAACLAAPVTTKVTAPTTSQFDPTPATLAITPNRSPIGTPTPPAMLRTDTVAPSRTPRRYELTQEAIVAASEPTVTPTLNATQAAERASAPCPAEKPALAPDFEFNVASIEQVTAFYRNVLDFLNAGGTRQAVIQAYHQHYPRADTSEIQAKDVTGDGVPDLLLTQSELLAVYYCKNGQYQAQWLMADSITIFPPTIVTIIDMNRDGIDEIIAVNGDDRGRDVYVFKWDGSAFQSLLNVSSASGNCSHLLGPDSWPYTQDTNGDGTLELVLKQGIPIWSEYVDGLPWRKEIRTCTWDGSAFVLTRTEITTPPEYRFQAVQDGDRASIAGDYAKALDLYQQAIFSDTLQAWSLDRYFYEGELSSQGESGAPTLMPLPTAISAEYPSLAAYARYRILLLHIVRGDLPDAKTVYNTLQAKFPAGQVGHADAEMATAFWDAYQASKSIAQACSLAIAYAAQHPTDVLAYLGRSEYSQTPFGDQSLIYTPEDVCPFH